MMLKSISISIKDNTNIVYETHTKNYTKKDNIFTHISINKETIKFRNEMKEKLNNFKIETNGYFSNNEENNMKKESFNNKDYYYSSYNYKKYIFYNKKGKTYKLSNPRLSYFLNILRL